MKNLINEIKNNIVSNYSPDKIILFGSHAYGSPNEYSDIDVLVVKDIQNSEIRDNQLMLYKYLRNIIYKNKIDIDILVNSEKEIKKRIELGDLFLKQISEEGKIIYTK